MKKVIILLFLSFLFTISYSQTPFTQSEFELHMIDENLPVGNVQGAHNVSMTGGAVYTIPIEVPQGINGMNPNISINYNSQGGDGILGMGWSLSGLSVITRTPKTEFSDGEKGDISFTNEDRFVLDGQRLVKKDGTYGSVGAEYGTEVESFSKIHSISGSLGNPGRFRVEAKDGMRYFYGSNHNAKFKNASGTKTLSWYLFKSQDRYNNYVQYRYHNDGVRQMRPNWIEYTKKGSSSSGSRIKFNYIDRVDQNTFYVNGESFNSEKLLSSIEITQNGDLVRKYEFVYGFNGVNTFLNEVILKGSNQTQLNSTIFKYNHEQSISSLDINEVDNNGNTIQIQGDFYGIADLNSDGKSDFITKEIFHQDVYTDYNDNGLDDYDSPQDASEYQIYGNDLNGNFYGLSSTNSQLLYDQIIANNYPYISKYKKLSGFVDFDGSSSLDFIFTDFAPLRNYRHTVSNNLQIVNNDATSLYDFVHAISLISNERTLDNETVILDDYHYIYSDGTAECEVPLNGYWSCDYYGAPVSDMHNTLTLGDYNGDGKSDFMTLLYEFVKPASSELSSESLSPLLFDDIANQGVFLETPVIEMALGFETYTQSTSNLERFPVTNLVQELDIATLANREFYDYHLIPMNIDGDVETEIVAYSDNQGNFKIFDIVFHYINGEIDYAEAVLKNDLLYPTGMANTLKIADFNGDGLQDLIYKDNVWKTLISKGNDTFHWSDQHSISTDILPNIAVKIGDFNRDGKSDIAYVEKNDTYTNCQSLGVGGAYQCDYYTEYDIVVHYSTGKGFQIKEFTNIFSESGTEVLPVQPSNYETTYPPFVSLGDFNGDGTSDLHIESLNKIFYINDNSHNLLSKIKDGFDNVVEFNYLPLSQDTDYNPEYEIDEINTATENTLTWQGAIHCVKSVFSPNGIGGLYENNYKYTGAKIHRNGKGFLGFREIEMRSPTMGTYSIDEYVYNVIVEQFLPIEKRTYTIQGDELLSTQTFSSEVINTHLQQTNSELNSANLGKYWVKQLGTTATNHLQGYSKTTIFEQYDEWGNPISVNMINGDRQNRTTYFNADNQGSWTFNKFETHVTETIFNGESLIHANEYSYNSEGKIENIIKYSGEPEAQILHSFTYTDRGFLEEKSTSCNDCNTKTVRTDYDSRGFPFMITNMETGDKKSIVMHPLWDKPERITEINGLETSYQYDEFGREYSVTNPAGITSDNILSWLDIGDFKFIRTETQSNYQDQEYITFYDNLGREVKNSHKGFDGTVIMVDKSYNAKGQVENYTSPYQNGQTPISTNYTYDYLNRPSSIITDLGNTTYGYNYDFNNKTFSTSVTTTPNGTSNGITKSQTVDRYGMTISSTDDAGTMSFEYDILGNRQFVFSLGASDPIMESVFDDFGRQTHLIDVNAGTTEYDYDTYGKLFIQSSANGEETTLVYDQLDRIETETVNLPNDDSFIKTYTYYDQVDITNGNGNGAYRKLWQVTSSDGIKEYVYDNLGRLLTEKKTIDKEDFFTHYTYNNEGEIESKTYPSGLVIFYEYNDYGYLDRVTNKDKSTIYFDGKSQNELGQFTEYDLGNGLTTTKTYTKYGMPKVFDTEDIINIDMTFDPINGNLDRRSTHNYIDVIKHEQFGYDDLERLTQYYKVMDSWGQLYAHKTQDYNYEPNGNIRYKSDVASGSYEYDDTKVNAVTNIPNIKEAVPSATQDITYTHFHQPQTITEGGKHRLEFIYGPNEQRSKTEYYENDKLIKEIFFVGDYEKIEANGKVYQVHYIGGGDGLCAMVIKTSDKVYSDNGGNNEKSAVFSPTTIETFYTHTDHLGSILVLTDNKGQKAHEQSFGPWGRYRSPTNYDYDDGYVAELPTWLHRGYTGHQHLPNFGLINMNGRMYDPLVGRMLSVDNYVHDQYGSQGYNRYSYALNNPLKFTDPDGEEPIALLIGAGIGVLSNGIINSINNKPFFQGALQAAALGAISGGASSAIGGAASSLAMSGWNSLAITSFQVGSHSLLGGITTSINGGNFWHGAVSGMAGSLIGGETATLLQGTSQFSQAFGTTLAGGLSGGIAAKVAGGDFWDGFRNGTISAGLNHAYHLVQDVILANQLERVFDAYLSKDGKGIDEISAEEAFSRVSPAALKEYKEGTYTNACATRLSLAFVEAGIKLPSGYGGLEDTNKNRIIISAVQMQKFMAKKYGSLMRFYDPRTSKNGIYIGLTIRGKNYSGHVTIIKSGFKSSLYESSMRAMYYWPIRSIPMTPKYFDRYLHF